MQPTPDAERQGWNNDPSRRPPLDEPGQSAVLRTKGPCPIRARSKGQTRTLAVTHGADVIVMTCVCAGLDGNSRSLPSWDHVLAGRGLLGDVGLEDQVTGSVQHLPESFIGDGGWHTDDDPAPVGLIFGPRRERRVLLLLHELAIAPKPFRAHVPSQRDSGRHIVRVLLVPAGIELDVRSGIDGCHRAPPLPRTQGATPRIRTHATSECTERYCTDRCRCARICARDSSGRDAKHEDSPRHLIQAVGRLPRLAPLPEIKRDAGNLRRAAHNPATATAGRRLRLTRSACH